jgi:hypothetical protein
VRKKVGDIKDLPAGTGPISTTIRRRLFIDHMLTADGLSLADLGACRDIRQRLRCACLTSTRSTSRASSRRRFIEFSHTKLATLGITPQQISRA